MLRSTPAARSASTAERVVPVAASSAASAAASAERAASTSRHAARAGGRRSPAASGGSASPAQNARGISVLIPTPKISGNTALAARAASTSCLATRAGCRCPPGSQRQQRHDRSSTGSNSGSCPLLLWALFGWQLAQQ